MVKVDIEYCGKCNFEWHCKMLQMYLVEHQPDAETVCHQGRKGSFEVKVNDILIYSKLKSLAFPDHQSILENVQRVENGLPLIKTKQQPIEDCRIV